MKELSVSDKLSYGLGQFGWSAKDVCFHYFLFFYYTQFLGLSASLAGLASLLALIGDGFSDPIIGQISDNWKSNKWGRRHPFMIAAVVPFAFALIAIFNPPEGLSQSALFIWYVALAIAVRTFLTLFTVPHMALGAELSEDYDTRTSIVVYRNFIGYSGGLAIQIIAFFLLIPIATSAGNAALGYQNVGIVAAALAFIGMLAAIFGTRKHIPSLPKTSHAQQSRNWYYAFVDIFSVLKQPSARVLLLGNLVMVTSIGVSNTMLLHINTYFYGFSAQQTGIFMLCIFLSLLPASLLAVRGVRIWGKPKAVVALLIIVAMLGPIPVLSHLYGLTPPSGSTGLLAVICFFVVLHQSFYIASVNIVNAMVPDVADEMALANGFRQEGVLNSAMMLTQKVTFGLGALFAGIIISFARLDGITDMADVTPTMLSRLGWMYGPGLSCMVLLTAVVYTRYRLSRARLRQIHAELNSAAT